MIFLSIPGAPQGQGRPRIGMNKGTGKPVAFTPKGTRDYAQYVTTIWMAQGSPELSGPYYAIEIAVVVARPESHFRNKGGLSAAGMRTPYPGKPDVDNVVKLILDTLVRCGCLPDDRFLVSLTAEKRWAEDGEQPGVDIHAHNMVIGSEEET